MGTAIVILILVAIVAAIVLLMYRDKKKGKSSCGGTCCHCPNSAMCHSVQKGKVKPHKEKWVFHNNYPYKQHLPRSAMNGVNCFLFKALIFWNKLFDYISVSIISMR